MKKLYLLLALVCLMMPASLVRAQLLAFPGADGYGKYTTGGRGGEVCYVTRTDDCSDNNLVEGTFRWALRHDNGGKPRTILFATSGTIYLTSKLTMNYPDVSILGQSAPGGGITLTGYPLYICKNNVIVRYVRFRAGDIPNASLTGLDIENCDNVILDHCSMTWSMEESLTAYDTDYTTVQWCIIGESLYNSKNAKGPRAYATQWGGEHSTMHHTLITNTMSRAPRFNGVRNTSTNPGDHDQFVDSEFANNVIFNWGANNGGSYGGENNPACNGYNRVYMINNYWRPGPATQKRYFTNPSSPYGEWYLNGNKFETSSKYAPATTPWSDTELAKVNADNYYGAVEGNANRGINITGTNAETYLMKQLPDGGLSGLTYETADAAFQNVTTKAGASLPRYDEVDTRLLAEAAGTADPRFKGEGNYLGIIDSPNDITLANSDTYMANGTTYTNMPRMFIEGQDKYMIDSDGDGMPDGYEDEMDFDKHDPSDGATIASNGYTNLENYLNGIADGTIDKTKYETSDFAVEPGLSTRPESVTYSYSCTDAAVEGNLPTGATVAYGTEVTIPKNISLYKEGYTLTAWTGNGRLFEPGKTYNMTSDVTLTPVFTANRQNLDDRSQETTVTWDFTLNGAPELSATAGSGIYVNQTDVDGYTIDTKVSYNNTTVTIPWCEGASVTVNGIAAMATAAADNATATVNVSASLPLQNIAVTLPYIRKITADMYHEAAVTAVQNYELVYTNEETIGACDWMEVNENYDQRWTDSYCYNPEADDLETKANYYRIPKVNTPSLGYLRMYITKTDKMRIFASGRSSNIPERLLVTAVPDDGSGAVTAQGNPVTKGNPDVFELTDLDPEKRYTVTFTSVGGYDMTLNAVKLYYGEEPVITSGEGTVTWKFSGTVDAEGTQNPTGIFSEANATVGSAFTVVSKKAYNTNFTGLQPAAQIETPNDDNTLIFNIKPVDGVYFLPQKLSFDVVRCGTDGGKIDVTITQGTGERVEVLTNFSPNRSESTSTETFNDYSRLSFDLSQYDNFISSTEPLTVRIDLYKLGNTKQVGFKNIVVSGEWNGTPPVVEQYTFNATVSPADAATVAWTPSGDTFDENTKISISLTPNGNYLFENWTDQSGNVVSTTENFIYTIKDNTELTANYKSYGDYGHIFEGVAPYDAAVKSINELKVALATAAARTDKTTRYRIFLHNGTYDYGTSAKNAVAGGVSLIGESQDGVIITNKPEATGNWADNTPTLFIDQTENDVYMQDLTVRQGKDWETQASTGQAMAVRQRGKRAVYKNVTLQGIQDTYYLNKGDATAYFETSTVAGQTDYIYGDGTAWFERCNLYNTGAGYIAAPNTLPGYKGMVFNGCTVDGAASAAGKFYLGRPWNDSPSATYLNTTFKQLPAEAGWAKMTDGLVLRFHEYGSMDANGTMLDLSARSTAACSPAAGSDNPVLTAEEAAAYTTESVLGTDWDPQSLARQLTAPAVTINGNNLTWQAVTGALGYAIVKDGIVIGFTTGTTFDISTIGAGKYSIRVANDCGGLGTESSSVSGIKGITADGESNADAPRYNVAGQRVGSSFRGIVIQNGKKKVVK